MHLSLQLQALLKPSRLTEIVDVGANPIDGEPPYRPMLSASLCKITGFEPQPDAYKRLLEMKGPLERYFCSALGDGKDQILRYCRGPGMTSTFEPSQEQLALFDILSVAGSVIERKPQATARLDDCSEIENLDFLKMDIQGGELSVLQNGRQKLKRAVCVQVEVSFMALYENQPCQGEIDLELRSQGFVPHCFAALKKWPIAPFLAEGRPNKALNQLLEADLVYVRNFARMDLMSEEQIRHLCLIAHLCYDSYDMSLHCILYLIRQGLMPDTAAQIYLDFLNQQNSQQK